MKFKLIRGNKKPPIRLQIDFLVICHFPVSRSCRSSAGGMAGGAQLSAPGLAQTGAAPNPHADSGLFWLWPTCLDLAQ